MTSIYEQLDEIARQHAVKTYKRERLIRHLIRPALITVGISVPLGIILGCTLVKLLGYIN